jgi:hypothetical protein
VSAALPAPSAAAAVESELPGVSRRVSKGLLGRLLRRVFCFPVALAGLLSALATLTVRGRFNDPDMWWHLKTGQFIWTTHTVPNVDLFSYTAGRHAWIPHEWLPQLGFYAVWRWGGFSGLMLLFCGLAAATLIAGYALCAIYSGNAKVAFLGSLVVFVFATTGFSIRPQLIGYLLLILEMVLVYLGRSRDARWFFALPPLFVLWINCHGSFFLGLILGGVLLFSSFFHFQTGSLVAESWDPRCRRMLLLALLLSAAALLLNPAGIKQVLYPLDTMLHQPINLGSVEEWQPLQLNTQRGVCLLIVLGAIFLLVLLRKAELHFDELLLLVLGTWLAGSHVRMLFVFGILAAPILTRMLATSWENYDAKTDHAWPNAVLLALSVTTVIWAFPSAQNLAGQIAEQSPVKAVEFIGSHHLTGPMLNEYQYGGYLIWAMPEHPVFIDGRADLYEWAGVLEQYESWAALKGDPNLLLDKFGVQFCLLTPQSAMAHVLPLLHGWKAIYADQNSVIFQRITIEPDSHIPNQIQTPATNPANSPTS